MPFVLAVDGGSTKTHCLVGDDKGRILAECQGGPSNHQVVGAEAAAATLQEVIYSAIRHAKLELNEISCAYLGLSGADLPSDFRLLESMLTPIFKTVPFKVVNDCWIALASGAKEGWGAVSVCGTGSNAAARNPEGKEVILRSLSYELGCFGGGSDLTVEALHHAFRSEEGTGPKTALENVIPHLAGVKDLDELANRIYKGQLEIGDLAGLPQLVFNLATEGDEVCQGILIEMGTVLGQMIAGVIKRAGMLTLAVPVVLAGSLYKGANPLLIDAFTLTLHRSAPLAKPVVPEHPPVIGAYWEALRWLGKKEE